MDWLLIIIAGVVVLTVLVVVHEAGHFFAARFFGVRVTEFMVGLPGPSVGFTRKGTRFGVTALPFGGYARVCGMENGPEDPLLGEALAYVYRHGSVDSKHLAIALGIDDEHADTLLLVLSEWGSITTPKGTLTAPVYLAAEREGYAKGQAREVATPKALIDEERKGTYRALSCWKRLVVLFAGPVANLLLAIFIFVALYSGHGVYEPSTLIYDVVADSPAADAGVKAGDRIVALDDVQTETWDSLAVAIGSYEPGDDAEIEFIRDGETQKAEVSFYENEDGATAIGIYADYELVHWSVLKSTQETFVYMGQVCEAIFKLFNPSTAVETLDQSASVVGIAYEAKAAASMGVLAYISLGAAISISLGLMNLLPIPPLDGGRILIEVIQKVIHRELPVKAVSIVTIAGIVLFSALFVYLLFQDIGRYVLGG